MKERGRGDEEMKQREGGGWEKSKRKKGKEKEGFMGSPFKSAAPCLYRT